MSPLTIKKQMCVSSTNTLHKYLNPATPCCMHTVGGKRQFVLSKYKIASNCLIFMELSGKLFCNDVQRSSIGSSSGVGGMCS